MKRVTVAILSLLVMAGLMVFLQAPIASATTALSVGGSVTPPPDNSPTGTVVAYETETFGAGAFAGSVTSVVVDVGGTYDFFYQVSNTSTAGGNLIESVTASIFTGYTTAVGYLTDIY